MENRDDTTGIGGYIVSKNGKGYKNFTRGVRLSFWGILIRWLNKSENSLWIMVSFMIFPCLQAGNAGQKGGASNPGLYEIVLGIPLSVLVIFTEIL